MLKKGTAFGLQRKILKLALIKKDYLSYIFYNIEQDIVVKYLKRFFPKLDKDYYTKVKEFIKKDRLIYRIIFSKIEESIKPNFRDNLTLAK